MMLQAWLPALTQPKQFGCQSQLAVTRLPTCTTTSDEEIKERFVLSRRYECRASIDNLCYQFPSIAIQS